MTDSVINHAVLDELRAATGDEFLAELITTFLDEAPAMIADLKEAALVGDADRFRRAAHSIKSNADTFGAGVLAGLARELELADNPQGPFDALDTEYTRAAAALKAAIDG